MRFTIAAAAALVAGASASYNYSAPAVYTTEVVSEYVTYCPQPTEITHGGKTYTVTEATTLTITDCPCTVTKPVESTPAPIYTPPVVPSSAPSSAPAPAPYPAVNGTTPAYTPPAATGTGSTTATPPAFTGAASKAFAASGAGLAAVFGLAAYIL